MNIYEYKKYNTISNNMSLILITSIIDTPTKPLSYTPTRSVYSKSERFDQTKQTIQSIKNYIPNSIIVLVEYSKLSEEEHEYFVNNVDHFINIYTDTKFSRKDDLHSIYKSQCEGTMTEYALKYIINNNINYEMFYKISGRYWINEHFEYKLWNTSDSIIHKIGGSNDNVLTALYKLNKEHTSKWFIFLKTIASSYYSTYGYEQIFAIFLNYINWVNVSHIDTAGVSGRISVCGSYLEI
jgi:hypothetical protein